MTRIYAISGAVALSALLGWTSYSIMANRATDPFAACRSGAVAGGTIGGPFSLVRQDGTAVTEAQVLDRPALVYFGYASCPDVCPLDNARNAEAVDLLAQQGLDVTPIFISVDPKRDTPQVMSEYISNFSEKMVGLTGTPEQVKAAANAYKVFYQMPEDAGDDYMVDHTTMTYLMLPKTGFATFFTREATTQDIVDQTGCFLKSS